jgi:hypothetical protein
VHDRRPHAEIIVSHLHGWMCASGSPSGSAEPAVGDWRTHLRIARVFFTASRQDCLLEVVDHALQLAGRGAVSDIVDLFASAETTDVRQRRR